MTRATVQDMRHFSSEETVIFAIVIACFHFAKKGVFTYFLILK